MSGDTVWASRGRAWLGSVEGSRGVEGICWRASVGGELLFDFVMSQLTFVIAATVERAVD